MSGVREKKEYSEKNCGLTLSDVYDIETEILFHHGDTPVRSSGPTPVPSSGATGQAGQAKC